jgi:hypothetical protein
MTHHDHSTESTTTRCLLIPLLVQLYTMSKPLRRPMTGPKRSLVGSSLNPRKPATGARAGTNARAAEEGYLYVAGVKDASNRVSEFRVGLRLYLSLRSI